MKNDAENPQLYQFITRFLDKIRDLFQKIRHKHLAFLFFVAIAAVTWLLRALGDEYVAEIEYPVEFINLPSDRVFADPPEKTLRLQVQADGYTILINRLKSKPTLKYDLNTFAFYARVKDSTRMYALTRNHKDRISDQLNLAKKNIEILDINPDTLIFHFTRIGKKRVPVIPDIADNTDKFAEQFMENGKPFADPDTVEVSGPIDIVDSLGYVTTRQVTFRNLSKTEAKTVELLPVRAVRFSPPRVKVTVPADEFTTSEHIIPIVSRNVPDSLTLKTFPPEVKVYYLITLSNYSKADEETFRAYVDFNGIDPSRSKKLRVELDPVPDYIHSLSIIPRNVEYLIEE